MPGPFVAAMPIFLLLLSACQSVAPRPAPLALLMPTPRAALPASLPARSKSNDIACRPVALTAERKIALFRQFAATQGDPVPDGVPGATGAAAKKVRPSATPMLCHKVEK